MSSLFQGCEQCVKIRLRLPFGHWRGLSAQTIEKGVEIIGRGCRFQRSRIRNGWGISVQIAYERIKFAAIGRRV